MPHYTSTQSGNFGVAATWGGSGTPTVAGDSFTVTVGHTVNIDSVYNVDLIASTVNGTLNFLNDRNTQLRFGHANLTISNGGRVSMGTLANPIPSQFTASLVWNPTSDSTIGLQKNDTGIFEAYGDSALYGNLLFGYLNANWTSGQTFFVTGDYTSWKSGQDLYVHRNTTFASITTDVALVTISGSPSFDGTRTTINIVEAFPTGTFFAGGLVMNATRNVRLEKVGAIKTIGNANTNRPRIDSQTGTSILDGSRFQCRDVQILGFGSIQLKPKERLENFVVRNGSNFLSLSTGGCSRFILNNGLITTYGFLGTVAAPILNNVYGFATSQFVNGGNNYKITNSRLFACLNGLYSLFNCDVDSNTRIFGTATGILTSHGIFRGILGISPAGQNSANGNDIIPAQGWATGGSNIILNNAQLRANTLTVSRNNVYGSQGKCYSAHHNQIKDAHWTFAAFGDIIRNTTIRRSGSASSIEVVPLSGCSPDYPIEVIEKWQEYNVPATAQQRIVYILGEGWTVFPTNSELFITAEFFNQSTGASTTIATSVLAVDDSTWVGSASNQKYRATLNFTPSQEGTVYYKVYLAKFQSACKIYIDNALYRPNMPIYTAYWKDGESYMEADFRGKFSIFGGNVIKRGGGK